MAHIPSEILEQGCVILDEVLRPHGFRHDAIVSGKGSGGPYATTAYVNSDRRLEIHFRFSLGLVSYHFGLMSVSHDEFMWAVLGSEGGNQYPGFSDEPAQSFRWLAHDLQNFAQSFLTGDGSAFGKFEAIAKKRASSTGFARLAESES